MSSAYLRLLIVLPAILIPVCASSSPAFHMMYSAGWQYTALMYSFSYLEPVCCSMSSLAVASWPAHRFLRRQEGGLIIPSKNFPVCFFPSSTQKNNLLYRNTSAQSGSPWQFTMVKEVLYSYCIWKLPIRHHTPGSLLLFSFPFRWSPFPVSSPPSQLSHLTTEV